MVQCEFGAKLTTSLSANGLVVIEASAGVFAPLSHNFLQIALKISRRRLCDLSKLQLQFMQTCVRSAHKKGKNIDTYNCLFNYIRRSHYILAVLTWFQIFFFFNYLISFQLASQLKPLSITLLTPSIFLISCLLPSFSHLLSTFNLNNESKTT